jgi:hypothetical protein
MPFGQPFRSTPATAPNSGAPAAYSPAPAAPAAPAAPSTPVAPPHVPQPAAELNWWVSVGGSAPVLLPQRQAAAQPGALVMREDQVGGWVTAAQAFGSPTAPTFGGPAAQAPAQAPAPGGFRQTSAPMGGAPRGAFAGVETAEVYQRNPMLHAGNYVVRITSAEYKSLRAGGNAVIIEMGVVVSSYDPNDPNSHQCNREGTSASVFIKQNDSFASNMKEIIIALSGFDQSGNPRPLDDVVTQAECEALVGAEQAYVGRYAYVEAREILTRQNKPFTRLNWSPCPLRADGTPDLERLAQGA